MLNASKRRNRIDNNAVTDPIPVLRKRQQMINTRLHALSDYVVPAGIALLSSLPGLGRVLAIPMRRHLVFDAAGVLTFVGAGVLAWWQPAWQRLLFGATELIEIAFGDDRDMPGRDVPGRDRAEIPE